MTAQDFRLAFAAFLGAATLCAIVTVATITSACQSARVGFGGDQGSERRRENGLVVARPQDGLSHPVNTGRHTGGKLTDLYAARARVAGGSPGFASSSAQIAGSFQPDTKEARHEEVTQLNPPTDINPRQHQTLQEKSTDGERVASAPKAINRAADRASNSATRAPRLVGLVNAGRDLGAMRPSHQSVTLGRDRDFANEARGDHDGGNPRRPSVSRSQGVRSVPAPVASPAGFGDPGRGHLPSSRTIERLVAACELCVVPIGIGMRLIARESGFRQVDSRGRLLVSSSGAVGIGQIKPSSAAEVSPTLDVRDEWQNLVASMCYLSSRRGTWREKVLAYRVGASGIRTAAAHAYASHVMGAAQ